MSSAGRGETWGVPEGDGDPAPCLRSGQGAVNP